MLHDLGEVTGPVALKPLSDDPVTLHIVEDIKVIYQAIGKAVGLNVLFDPDYQSKRIPVDLTRVSYADALRIVGLVSGTFYKPVTPDTIFVAQNLPNKHSDLDDLAVQTFFLSNVSQPNDGNEMQTAVRNVLPPTAHVFFVASQNALIVRATTDQLLLVQKLLNDLDRPKAEVVVDVAILEVNKDHVRNLGITLPHELRADSADQLHGFEHKLQHVHGQRFDANLGHDYDDADGLELHAEYAWEPERDQFCGYGDGRDAERAADGHGYAGAAESVHPSDRWAAGDAEDRFADSDRDGVILGGCGDRDHGRHRRADAISVCRHRRKYRHDADGASGPRDLAEDEGGGLDARGRLA